VTVVWTRKARLAIRQLHAHIEKDSLINADGVIKRILDAVKVVANLLRIGKVLPGTNDERIRERIVRSQRVINAIDEEQQIINILVLVHVRQDITAMKRKPWE